MLEIRWTKLRKVEDNEDVLSVYESHSIIRLIRAYFLTAVKWMERLQGKNCDSKEWFGRIRIFSALTRKKTTSESR